MAGLKPKELGFALIRARAATRLEQREMASRCGVSVRTYSRWENRYLFPSVEQLRSIVRAFYELDEEEHAVNIARIRGATLESLRIVVPPPPPQVVVAPPPAVRAPDPPPVPVDAVRVAIYVASEELEIPARRLRPALARLLKQLGALGVNVEQAHAVVAAETTVS